MTQLDEDHFYLHSKNLHKKYHDKLSKNFKEWLKKCPVQYKVSTLLKQSDGAEKETTVINFYQKEWRDNGEK